MCNSSTWKWCSKCFIWSYTPMYSEAFETQSCFQDIKFYSHSMHMFDFSWDWGTATEQNVLGSALNIRGKFYHFFLVQPYIIMSNADEHCSFLQYITSVLSCLYCKGGLDNNIHFNKYFEVRCNIHLTFIILALVSVLPFVT